MQAVLQTLLTSRSMCKGLRAMSLGISVVIVLAVAILFAVVMIFIIYPMAMSSNTTLMTFADKIVNAFS